jgi:hypothetical protein
LFIGSTATLLVVSSVGGRLGAPPVRARRDSLRAAKYAVGDRFGETSLPRYRNEDRQIPTIVRSTMTLTHKSVWI